MKCHHLGCPAPTKGHRYVIDDVHVCMGCCELNRTTHAVTLEDFVRLPVEWQRMIGLDRQMVQEAMGQWDYLKHQGVEILRA